MNDYKKDFPLLFQYLGGLFHQDWIHVFDWKGKTPNYEGVVRYFKTQDENSRIESELNHFLELKLTSSEIEDVMKNVFNVGIRPAFWHITHKQWLEHILEILEEPMEKTKNYFIPDFIG